MQKKEQETKNTFTEYVEGQVKRLKLPRKISAEKLVRETCIQLP